MKRVVRQAWLGALVCSACGAKNNENVVLALADGDTVAVFPRTAATPFLLAR